MNRELKKLFKENYVKIPVEYGRFFIGNRRVLLLASSDAVLNIEAELGIIEYRASDKTQTKKMKEILKAAKKRFPLKPPVSFEKDKSSEYAACYTQAKEYLAFAREDVTESVHEPHKAFIVRKHEYNMTKWAGLGYTRRENGHYYYGFLLNGCPVIAIIDDNDKIVGFIFCEQHPQIQYDGESLKIEGLKIKGV